jgi:diguanylate cyclase (GGDEF)-like protein
MHSLLARQLRRHGVFVDDLGAHCVSLLTAISDAYEANDSDREMIERSLEISSRELIEANNALVTKGALMEATLESTADGILAVAQTGEVLYSNQRFLDLWHVPSELARNGSDADLIQYVLDQLDDPEAFLLKVRELYSSHDESNDILHFRDGRIFERYSRPLLRRGSLAGRVWSFRDVTQRQRDVQRIVEQARRDSLTGALNHGGITQHLMTQLQDKSLNTLLLAMVDVDAMKAVNDTYGHLAGDAVLNSVAAALSVDSAVVGRYGGDEFVVVIRDADRRAGEAYVIGVQARLRENPVTDRVTGSIIRLPVSVGLAVYPDEASSMAELIQVADAGMYASKHKRAIEEGREHRQLTDHVSQVVADLVPLVTSSGKLEEKLRLVAARLSTGTGYDAVDCQIFRDTGLTADSSLHEGQEDELTEHWRSQQRRDDARSRPINVILEKTRRPLILEDIAGDERLNEAERSILAAAKLQSAVVAPMFSDSEFIGTVAVARREKAAFDPRDAQFLGAVASQVSAIIRMAALMDGMQQANERVSTAQAETVLMLAAAAEAHDQTTGDHLQSIRRLTEIIAREMGYDEDQVRELGLAATLHDIGKISVPDNILSSPMRFDADDGEFERIWQILKRHTVWGADFLSGRSGFDLAERVARWHHERWDGGGYPDGLRDDEIPREVAIVTVADAFDAMVQDRPYRAGRPLAAALREIVACKGKQFSPEVVDALCRIYSRGELHGFGTSGEEEATAA